MIYRCENLSFSYKLGTQFVKGLTDINLSIPKKSFVCLIGPSGSGKSTLLNILGLIEPIQIGHLYFDQQNLEQISEREKNHIRRFQLGFIFQRFHLIEVLSAYENVSFFLSRQGIKSAERKKRVFDALEAVGLWELKDKRPSEMSGGQRQRVAIARALAKHPSVIIADEPTASLDQENGRQVMEVLQQMNKIHGITIIVSSHDPMVQNYAKDTIKLLDGRIC